MQREEKSERSRRLVLDTALDLFSRQGYRATTMRAIADAADVSTGAVYHHFADKKEIFKTLVDELIAISDTRRFPFRRALLSGRFPDNLESLGMAARESVREFRDHFRLIYIDVIEFEGTHIRELFSQMVQRYSEEMTANDRVSPQFRQGVSPVSALLLTTRIFFSYFSHEILFNVPPPFGKDAARIVEEMADIIRNGVLK
ncbi:MAG TPA: TetR/AcrR family transcriptional regulator [Thermoanaerobaculia bacterium]|nr:TetR/AcrR family transcriptional regulator [Thermoanaerobaculia bacterium]